MSDPSIAAPGPACSPGPLSGAVSGVVSAPVSVPASGVMVHVQVPVTLTLSLCFPDGLPADAGAVARQLAACAAERFTHVSRPEICAFNAVHGPSATDRAIADRAIADRVANDRAVTGRSAAGPAVRSGRAVAVVTGAVGAVGSPRLLD
ncbi:hypothetical protein [Oleisolibacter albus]|uniref:hypothetical protein n=1 Tax=Oleisolibacter albus TaxID=2171757 RepID=UPI0012D7EC1B|nr:hypothetical protein [Oleisolibacter albus]